MKWCSLSRRCLEASSSPVSNTCAALQTPLGCTPLAAAQQRQRPSPPHQPPALKYPTTPSNSPFRKPTAASGTEQRSYSTAHRKTAWRRCFLFPPFAWTKKHLGDMELGQLKAPAHPVGCKYLPLPSSTSYYNDKVLTWSTVFLRMPNRPWEALPAPRTEGVSDFSPSYTNARILGLLIPDWHFWSYKQLIVLEWDPVLSSPAASEKSH